MSEVLNSTCCFRLACCPGGTTRNYDSYGSKAAMADGATISSLHRSLLCDPQTSGGLLIAVQEGAAEKELNSLFESEKMGPMRPIGVLESLERAPSSGIFVLVE